MIAIRSRMVSQLWLSLFVGVACVWCIFPFYWMVTTSLRPTHRLYDRPPELFPTEITFDHYIGLFFGWNFWTYAFNSFWLTGIVTLLALALAIPGGYALARYRFVVSKLLPFIVLYAQLLPSVLLVVPFYAQLRRWGLLDSLYGLVPVYLSFILPLCLWLLRGFFVKIPIELEEAALIDGCTRWQVLWRIVIPVSSPGIVAVGTWAMIQAWNEYLYAATFLSGDDRKTLTIALSAIIGERTTDWGRLMAGGVVTSIPIIIIFSMLQRYLVSGLAGGSVKG
ncbi:MAG: carbohydrate ABC transporter permease [Hyphomicrobiales bacterium]|nr:carbohydrate ABC transporter permease [Hyphomicrobiales bacterium]